MNRGIQPYAAKADSVRFHFCKCKQPVRNIFKASTQTRGKGLRQESSNGEPHLCPVFIFVGAPRREPNIELDALIVSFEFVEWVVAELRRDGASFLVILAGQA